MSTTPDTCGRVLHVTDDVGGGAEEVSRCLRDRGADVMTCTDVYQAIVWLGRGDSPSFDAVVVNLDWLTSGEFEFISLVRSMPTSYPVFVHARAESAEKIERALLMQASGTVDGTFEGVGPVFAACRDRDEDASPDETDERPALVPWNEQGGRPERVPPPGPQDAGETVGSAHEAGVPKVGGDFDPVARDEDDAREAPLLSSEEIECLIFGGVDDGSVEVGREEFADGG